MNKIKSNKDIKNLDENTKDDLSFKFVKFADLGYKKRSKKKENFFPEPFMNLEIINYKLLGKNNFFYVVKDTKKKN